MAAFATNPSLSSDGGGTTSTAHKPVRGDSLIPATRLIQISRSLSHRLQEAKSELAKEIESAKNVQLAATERRISVGTLKTTATAPEAEDLAEEQTGPTEMIMEIETADEKMRSTYWGLELLYKTGAIDPTTHIYALWLGVVAFAFLYNIWTMTLREAFPQYGAGRDLTYWLITDYLCDAVYLIDIVVIKARIMYHNEEGQMVYDRPSTRRKYFKSSEFRLDVLALVPLDILYAIPQIGVRPGLRFFRLIKVFAFWEFFDRVGSLLQIRDLMNILKMVVYILLMIHVFTCCYYAFSVHVGIGTDQFAYQGDGVWPYAVTAYSRCFYLALKIATSINSDLILASTEQRLFMTASWLVATFIVVVLLAQIREIFFGLTRDEEEFTRMVYTAVSYLKRYNCPAELENKVRSWFMYMRATQKVLEMHKVLAFLPRHIQTALALEINYKTLSKVSLFANCDRTVLTDLVVKLKPVLYLPGDYICKKGEIGKEMYIIVKGQAEVVGPEGQIFVTLSAGAVFGEISLLAVGGANRRTANVRSKGFSNLFTLSKDDFEEIMQQYPLIYARLQRKVAETLARSNAPPPPPPPPAGAHPSAATATSATAADASKKDDAQDKSEAAEVQLQRPKTPKLLQLLRALLPNMPTLRRIFRVHPASSPTERAVEILTISDSVDAEIAELEWSTPSPETFYVRSEAEQQFWDAPESVTQSALGRISAVTQSRSDTYASDEDSSMDSASSVDTAETSKPSTAATNKKSAGDRSTGQKDSAQMKKKYQTPTGGGGTAASKGGASKATTGGRVGVIRQQTGKSTTTPSSIKGKEKKDTPKKG